MYSSSHVKVIFFGQHDLACINSLNPYLEGKLSLLVFKRKKFEKCCLLQYFGFLVNGSGDPYL